MNKKENKKLKEDLLLLSLVKAVKYLGKMTDLNRKSIGALEKMAESIQKEIRLGLTNLKTKL